jgi:hypothetical protein
MNAQTKITPETVAETDPLAKLREPFPENLISKLPKPTKKQTDDVKADYMLGMRCKECGSWHHKDVVHLDYVGHAALTHRLLDTDREWSWEPLAFRDGLPAFDATGGLWIKLTICGVTRLGYGHAAPKPNQDPGSREKEVIGDALRNAAMRFGAALDLWHKGDLHADDGAGEGPKTGAAELAIRLLCDCKDGPEFKEVWAKNAEGWKALLDVDDLKRVWAVKDDMVAKFKRQAEATAPKEPAAEPPAQVDPFDDEIPF